MNTIELLNDHRSVRAFKSKAVEQEKLDRILECGGRASNTGNMQIYSVVVTREPENVAALSKLHFCH